MATSGETCPPKKKHVRQWVCYQTELTFSTEADKKDFVQKLEQLKSTMFSKKSRSLDIHELSDILLDMMDEGDNGGNETSNDSSGRSQEIL